MSDDKKKELKKAAQKPGYKVVVKKSKAGLEKKMQKRGYTPAGSTASGQTTKKGGTAGGHVVKTTSRYSAFQKKKSKRGPASSYRNVRSL